ncbi:TetR family transcriptional regulator [Sphingomonas sp. HMWF008]|nr:TetR family transcriptional regulator [Sphingomonas sp. HMWF008]
MTISPRKQPLQPRARATVEAILEAAAHILESRGLAGYNTNAVAERAGVSIGSLYQYFPGKDAVMAALIRRETALLLAEAETAGTFPGAREGLIQLINAAVRHQLRRPVLARLIDGEEVRLPLDADNRGIEATMTDLVADILRRPGVPRAANRTVAARDLVAIVKGMVDAAGIREERDEMALARRVRAAVFGYLDRLDTSLS